MSKWHIHKKSRMPGFPYFGLTCDHASVPSGKVYDDKGEAQRDADKLSEYNPVGFEVSPYPYIAPDMSGSDFDGLLPLRLRMAEVRATKGKAQ